jgi:hypothetical protein
LSREQHGRMSPYALFRPPPPRGEGWGGGKPRVPASPQPIPVLARISTAPPLPNPPPQGEGTGENFDFPVALAEILGRNSQNSPKTPVEKLDFPVRRGQHGPLIHGRRGRRSLPQEVGLL